MPESKPSPRFKTPEILEADILEPEIVRPKILRAEIIEFESEGEPQRPRVAAAVIDDFTQASAEAPVGGRRQRRWFRWPDWCLGRAWDLLSLLVLLAVVAAIPLVQMASLGYLLRAAAKLATGGAWSEALPGLRRAGLLGTFTLLATLSWLPVWLVTDVSYSAQLLQPGTSTAAMWRSAAFVASAAWVLHVAWAAMRGGRWWHFLWPAPLRFLKQAWRPATWQKASDQLYDGVISLQFPQLWWLGARAAVGAMLWTCVPVTMMIIGQRSPDMDLAPLIGLVGAIAMIAIMLYLPFLQLQVAIENRFMAILNVRQVRRRFLFAPLAHAFSLLLLCVLCIPLYLLRIEAAPAELLWAPSFVFVVFMLPAKLCLGAAMGYANARQQSGVKSVRHWTLRWPARVLALASVLVYVGALYVAQLVAGQGALVMYFQHAFLVPAPLIST
ncbi:hypothetical protein [Aureliella helgolandensis]|uniref:DUF4013 domain-containing protein n=1 Tax=Aureliella helgolandensis TaxID=2527968 RepID=A0A518G132_9BACT|nr:hypothetical protein [Aureliella helgolandensis]QDV22286.1 hypothetical protein Q31a_05700 [Aureliella helgolandensis]